MRRLPLPWVMAGVVAVVVAAGFAAWELLERTLLQGVSQSRLHQLHLGRGIVVSLLVGVALMAYVMNSMRRELPIRGDTLRPHGTSDADPVAHERNRWLISMRWALAAVVGVMVFLAAFAVPIVPTACRLPLSLSAGAILVANAAFARAVRHGWMPSLLLPTQFVADLVLLAVLLHFSGGIENPLTGLYLIHVILAGILLTPRAATAITGLAIALMLLTVVLEASQLLTHYPIRLFPHPAAHAPTDGEAADHTTEPDHPTAGARAPEGRPRHEAQTTTEGGRPLHAAHDPLYAGASAASLLILMLGAALLTASLRASLRASEGDLLRSYKMSALGRLSAGLAHEINNPVGIASARVQLLLEQDAPESVSTPLRVIARQLERVSEIVRGMRTFSRSQPGNRIACDLLDIVRDSLAAAPATRDDPRLELLLPGAGLAVTWGNPAELSQVVLNLLLNALAATPAGGRLRVSVTSNADAVRFIVEDSGVGVPPGERSRIFEPFHTTRFDEGGTGLGLAIVQSIVTSHEGEVTVGDSPLGGAAFTVRLPAAYTGRPHDL